MGVLRGARCLMHVALLVPGSLATISGGYAYDRAMVDNLRTLGHSVEVIELSGRFPLGDDDALSAVRRAWDALPAVVVPVIDGLCLPAFTPDMLASRRAVGLIHHPTALEHGVPDDDRLRLRATERELLPSPGGDRGHERCDRRTARCGIRRGAGARPGGVAGDRRCVAEPAARARTLRRSCRWARWCRGRGTMCCSAP